MTSQADRDHAESVIRHAMDAAITARDVTAHYHMDEATERVKWALDFLHIAAEKVREAG